jgi:hypothetical protein
MARTGGRIVEEIDILLIGLPPLVSDILRRSLADAQGARIVGELPSGSPLLEAVGRTGAHCAVVHEHEPGLAGWRALLHAAPELKLLTIASNARRAVLYELRPSVRELEDISPAVLLQVIADAVADPA